jgi:G3E family GTPase
VVAAVGELAPRAVVRIAPTVEHAAWLDELLEDPPVAVPPPAHVHDDHCRHGDHGIESTWVPARGVVDLEELEDQLADLPGSYVRIKGIVHAVDGRVGQDTPRWVAVHRVGLRVSSEPAAALPEGRVVALGPRVDREELADHVARAMVKAS